MSLPHTSCSPKESEEKWMHFPFIERCLLKLLDSFMKIGPYIILVDLKMSKGTKKMKAFAKDMF